MASSAVLAASIPTPILTSTSTSTSAATTADTQDSAAAATATPTSPSTLTNILESLPPRPPTPPREATHEVEVSLKSVLGRPLASDPRQSLQTPPTANSSPTSSAAAGSNPGSSRLRKRVEWSAHTEYKEPQEFRKDSSFAKSSPISAPSSANSKPVKGILKASLSHRPLTSSLASDLDGPAGHTNITEMLDSTIKQLAGSDRESKVDAYMMLARALKASNNLPDRVALQGKMSLFMQFIQRDITSKTDNWALESSLVNHALNLLATFLHFPAIASTLTSDFGIFITDHAIRSFEGTTVPKDVVRHLMQVIAFQNFSNKVMTPDRVGRLVAALHKIEDHLKGKSIVMSRIHIYKRLVQQSRNHMVFHPDWLKDLFTDMLSSIKDIRAQAISLGLEAGFAFRSEKQLMRKVAEIFQTTNEEEPYISFYIQQLQNMIKDKQSSSAVPQIWSVVILFLRCPLERWQYYGPWLKLAQSAFNMTDGLTKQEANYAWNRYVYISFLESTMTPKTLSTLCQPLLSQLRRKSNPKQPEEAVRLRRVVIGGICNLYYYAFAPGSDKCSPDSVWDVAVEPVMTQLISLDGKPDASGDCMMQASRMLVGLLDVSTPRVWRQDRIMDTPPAKVDELPPIDSKWIRRNCEKVFQSVGPIMEKKILDMADPDSLTYRLWQALVGSVAVASAKDIKVSEDTAKFFACTFGLLSTIWSKGIPGNDGTLSSKFLASAKNFINILVGGLGMLPFTEKRLSMTVANTFEPITTPSHRPDRVDKSRGVVRIPLHHLFCMLCSTPPGGVDDGAFAELFQSVFEPFFNGRNAKSRGELAQELLHLLPRNSPSPSGPWLLAAQNMRLRFDNSSSTAASSPASGNVPLGPDYREIVSLLERGLTSHPNLPPAEWFSLLSLVSEHAVQEFGDAGRALAIIEPLARILLDGLSGDEVGPSATAMQASRMLFEQATLPRDRQALDVARRRLWGTPPMTLRSGSFDPFDNLYKLGNRTMVLFYDRFSEFSATADSASFMTSLESFMTRCFSLAFVKTLSQFQSGLCAWILDEDAKLQLGDDSPSSKSVFHLWDQMCAQLASQGRLEKKELDQIEPLLTAGFKSKHRSIVSRTADAWNKMVKDDENIEASDSLKSVISSLRSKADLILPGTEQSSGDFGAQASSFIVPQHDASFVAMSSTSSHHDAEQSSRPLTSTSTTGNRLPLTRKRRMDTTPEVVRAKPPKRTSTPRLRHDNSQIHFAPIASSSPLRGESQHLTERQKETRERQRENATLYSAMRSSSPPQSQDALPSHPRVAEATDSSRPQETTPERTTAYEDLVSSTPTPRRGQVVQMDDDVPSSPLVPRPYPLLSEIQSRSRASSALESWEFSSPPGSPVPSHQQVVQDAELPHMLLTDDGTGSKLDTATKDQEPANIEESEHMDVIPSSAATEGERAVVTKKKASLPPPSPPVTRKRRLRQRAPATPPQKRQSLASERKVKQTSKLREDDTPDAGNDVESLSSQRATEMANKTSTDDIPKDMSFALSEGEESQMMKFAIQMESRKRDMPIDPTGVNSPEKGVLPEPETEECITVLSSSPQAPITRRSSKRLAPSVIPSTPVEPDADATDDALKGRKKRGGSTLTDSRGKRRRSVENDVREQTKEPQAAASDQPKSSPSAPRLRRTTRQAGKVETRGSARRKSQQSAAKDSIPEQAPKSNQEESARKDSPADDGDTDEEVMSQLVAESRAASQSQSRHEAEAEEEDVPPNEEDSKVDLSPAAGTDEESEAKDPLSIMGTLRDGLKQLKSAALSRDDVYKMEDMLMDMKRELFEAERRGRE